MKQYKFRIRYVIFNILIIFKEFNVNLFLTTKILLHNKINQKILKVVENLFNCIYIISLEVQY